jgi:O-antigen ligase
MMRVVLAGCLLLLALGQFWLGQRGPVLALAISAAYLLAIVNPKGAHLWQHRGVRYGLLGLLLIGGLLVLPRVLPRVKLATVMSDPRVGLAQEWVNLFLEHPVLGIGVGAFSYGDLSDDPRAYAHNIFGELLSESGLLGFGVFLLFFVLVYRFARQARDGLVGRARFWHQTSLGMALYTLATAQVSGDLTTNYMVWVSLALVYATAEPGRAPVTAVVREPYPWEIEPCASSS